MVHEAAEVAPVCPTWSRGRTRKHHSSPGPILAAPDWADVGPIHVVQEPRRPDAQIGYSILVYHVNDEELNEALNGPPP